MVNGAVFHVEEKPYVSSFCQIITESIVTISN